MRLMSLKYENNQFFPKKVDSILPEPRQAQNITRKPDRIGYFHIIWQIDQLRICICIYMNMQAIARRKKSEKIKRKLRVREDLHHDSHPPTVLNQ